jgi:imidazolonepropionase-like amidohydrolase
MQLYVDEVGIAAVDVLRWATKHGAEAMGLANSLGTVTEGKMADLLVVRGDPTQDISVLTAPGNFVAIMQDGRFFKAPQL